MTPTHRHLLLPQPVDRDQNANSNYDKYSRDLPPLEVGDKEMSLVAWALSALLTQLSPSHPDNVHGHKEVWFAVIQPPPLRD